jgi:ligand-binding sensor protein
MMNLTDIMPIEAWVDIEKEIHKRSGLNAAVYDVNGLRITDFKGFANQLCPALRETGKGQKFICAVAHQNMAFQAARTGKSVVAECDAGLMKFVVPIIIEGEFLGTAGGCGLLREGEQVDAYLIHRTTGLVENQVQQLASDIDIIPSEKVNEILDFVKTRVSEAIEQFNSGHIAAAAG